MKKLLFSCLTFAIAATAVSCLKNFEENNASGQTPNIPFDFQWEMTRDAAITVGLPSVDGQTPKFALVNVYSSPVLTEDNLLAQGMVDAQRPTMRAAFTMLKSVDELYVQFTIPDGSTTTTMVAVTGSELNVSNINLSPAKSTEQLEVIKQALAESALVPKKSTMVIPVKEPALASYDVTFSQNPASKFVLGSDNKQSYLIPAGVTITDKIDMTTWFNNRPTLYVAGRLVLKEKIRIEKSRLVVLDGGEVVTEGALEINNAFEDQASVYINEGASLTSKTLLFLHGKLGLFINEGDLYITGRQMKMSGGKLYTKSGVNPGKKGVKFDDVDVVHCNFCEIHNDGVWSGSNFRFMTNNAILTNYENGVMNVDNMNVSGVGTIIEQRGVMVVESMKLSAGSTLNNYCNTEIEDLSAIQSTVSNASGALLHISDEATINQASFNLAANSLCDIESLEAQSYMSTFTAPTSGGLKAVVRIKNSDYKDQWNANKLNGLIELVCSSSTGFMCSGGATIVKKQTVNIPASDCNGGAGQITPAPIDPETEFDTKGAGYTYCFEDGWPWAGDYDMNDMVVSMRVDRKTKDGKVVALRINWSPKASGAENTIACALQLDKIPTSNIASVVSSAKIGMGAFVVEGGLERDNDMAVVPLFNRVSEVLGQDNGFVNTIIGGAKIPALDLSTTITFTTPVETDAVTESAINLFLVVSRRNAEAPERWREIHLASFQSTKHAVVTGLNTIYEKMPYKFFAIGSSDTANNGLMWGLRIPGVFRYPSERNDIRTTYKEFLPWAQSGGAINIDWYKGEVVEDNIYK